MRSIENIYNLREASFALATLVACTNAQVINLITSGYTIVSFDGYIKAEGGVFFSDKGVSNSEGNVREF